MSASLWVRRSLALLAGLIFLAGCGIKPDSPAATSNATAKTSIRGSVHGGQQPVGASTIQLYGILQDCDNNGCVYETTPLLNGGVDVYSNSDGSFDITNEFTCPGPFVPTFLVATGGVAAGSYNSAINLMAITGPCSSLNSASFFNINELTTVATVFAFYPLCGGCMPNSINSPEELYYSPQAVTLAQQLVNVRIGGAPGVGVPNGDTVPTAMINTLGNIIAACINSTGYTSDECNSLFRLTGGTDTFSALYNIAYNPTNNITDLFALTAPGGPFQPQLTAAPTGFYVNLD